MFFVYRVYCGDEKCHLCGVDAYSMCGCVMALYCKCKCVVLFFVVVDRAEIVLCVSTYGVKVR